MIDSLKNASLQPVCTTLQSAEVMATKQSYTVDDKPLNQFLETIQKLQLLQALTSEILKNTSCFPLAIRALSDRPFSEQLQEKIGELPEKEKDKYLLELTHAKIRHLSKQSLPRKALDFASPSFIEERLFKNTTLEAVLKDAEKLAETLAPRVRLQKNPNGDISGSCITNPYSLEVDAILMMGNNDLNYVDYTVDLFRRLPNREKIQFFVMGFGGYGTTAKPIFFYTEAATIAERLYDLGIPRRQIVIESTSTTTVQNISFLAEILRKKKASCRHFLVMGTPMAQLRQSRLIEKKAQFEWESLSTYPTRDFSNYFKTKHEATANLLFCLTEFVFSMAWCIDRSAWNTSRPIGDRKLFCQNFKLVCSYFKKLSRKDVSHDQDAFLEAFFTYIQLADSDLSKESSLTLKSEIMSKLDVLKTFFRTSFDLQARLYMPRLSSKYSFVEQATLLNDLQSSSLHALDITKNYSPYFHYQKKRQEL